MLDEEFSQLAPQQIAGTGYDVKSQNELNRVRFSRTALASSSTCAPRLRESKTPLLTPPLRKVVPATTSSGAGQFAGIQCVAAVIF